MVERPSRRTFLAGAVGAISGLIGGRMLDNNIPVPQDVEHARLLGEGACINSLGRVYRGPDAPQRAIDDVLNNAGGEGQVWLGNSRGGLSGNSYDEVVIESDQQVPMRVVGIGNATRINSEGRDHALKLIDPQHNQVGLARLRIQDVTVKTGTGHGQNYDGVHVRGASETWLTRVESQNIDRDNFNVAPRNGLYLNECFGEGAQRHGVHFTDSPNGSGQKTRVTGGEINGTGSDVAFKFTVPNGNSVTRAHVSGTSITSGGGAPWLDDATGGSVFSSLVDGVTKVSGGTNIASGSTIVVGETA